MLSHPISNEEPLNYTLHTALVLSRVMHELIDGGHVDVRVEDNV